MSGKVGALRNKELIQLDKNPFLNVEIVTSDFLNKYPEEHDIRKALLIYGQELSLPEVGCASSHVKAYKKQIQNEHNWVLVLEDDAIIDDSVELISLGREIMKRETMTPEVISLYYHDTVIFRNVHDKSLAKVFGYPVGAVGYFINLSAARTFSSLNANLIFKADWPRCQEVNFLVSQKSIVRHPENFETSYIEMHRKNQRKFLALLKKFRDFTLLTYFSNRTQFLNLRDYKVKLIYPPLYYWIGRFISKPIHAGEANRKLLLY